MPSLAEALGGGDFVDEVLDGFLCVFEAEEFCGEVVFVTVWGRPECEVLPPDSWFCDDFDIFAPENWETLEAVEEKKEI